MISMDDVYKITHYLHSSKLDRQYPYEFDGESITLQDNNNLVLESIGRDFDGIDTIEVYANCHGTDVGKAYFKFSPSLSANVYLLVVEMANESLPVDEDCIITFKVDNNYEMNDKSNGLTGIERVVLEFENNSNVEIYDIVFRTNDYEYSLDDIQEAYYDGLNHVLRRLNDLNAEKKYSSKRDVPSQLQKYIFMSAGAYAWITRWEYEAKPMKEPQSESNNYADRLLNQVDTALSKYLITVDNNPDDSYINTDLSIATSCNWGIR